MNKNTNYSNTPQCWPGRKVRGKAAPVNVRKSYMGSRRRWQSSIEINLTWVYWWGMNETDSRQDQRMGFCKNGKKTFSFCNCWEFSELLNDICLGEICTIWFSNTSYNFIFSST